MANIYDNPSYKKLYDFLYNSDNTFSKASAQMKNFGNGLKEWFKAKTGQNLSGAQREANEFNAAEAQKARDFEVQMYEQYESPAAMIRQYEEAGLNPALMYEGYSPSAVGGNAQASSVSPTPNNELMSMLSGVLGIVSAKQQIDLNKANIRNIDAATEGQRIDNANKQMGYDKQFALADANIEKIQSEIEKNSAEVNKTIQDIRESESRVELNGTEKEVKESQKVLNNLNAENLRQILPYVQKVQEAQLALTNAQTSAQRAQAEKTLNDAEGSMLSNMVQYRLLDNGYYETMMLNQKREGAVMVGNAIVGNTCKVIDSVVGIINPFKIKKK